MSETFNVKLPSGETWTPTFVSTLDEAKCIGCGRCFKVCPRGVLELVGVDEDGEHVALDSDSDDDDEYEKKVMTIAHRQLCIGCTACAKICPKKCYTHAAAQV
ncbi:MULTISPECIES: ferredoxin III, nif-specific [Burkholderia]|uniref:Ferredoxin III n=3 Tax=Burkholderia cepacia complex TaxID=87882 RepID=A4JRP7_BURVG|nr:MULTISPECIES: ferredoxin III, nif-specific [Burkholderia]ABO58950.1 4Fe-4S ferredoxin, iron-sulfur binding domain protein [Burkholderia vietnamiensis G4]AOJ17127.1 ferredoxin [Burkholderia vietnamiensis]AOJ76602.1 ferredoxin [Burkholderia ubonensis]AOK13690.1 ferredoxin [Burkholderia vietnamiensis]KKI38690.1 ferredoxin [Burkholderia vietnamiensis]